MARVKGVKGWAVVDNENMLINNWYQFYCIFMKRKQALNYSNLNYKIIPVLITPIKQKRGGGR